ncbi:beta-1,6-galactofuranosyltransferase, partial [Klebsiella pneumoniae]|nr:beta-1,6-galactofuranosyltransferase [Klebsiella pneumoniae]
LYLAAGLPVIIWKEAAMAELIVKENLGFTVGSLREIGAIVDTMTEGTYNQMRDNVLRYAPLLKEGYFFKEALKKVYEMI